MLDGAGAASNPRRREPLFTVLMDHETFLSGTLHPGSVLEAEVLMLGREERYANREVRRALAARDRGCAAPGCSAPVSHCDAHHVTWWEHEGLTNADEMALLCRHHHRMVHAGSLEIMMVNGLPAFLDRYGNELTKRAEASTAPRCRRVGRGDGTAQAPPDRFRPPRRTRVIVTCP